MGKVRLLDLGGAALSGAIPVAAAVSRAGTDGLEAACDRGVVRVVGRGYTGLSRGLDALVGAPLGIRAHWASVACAAGLGVATYLLARRLLRTNVRGPLAVALAVVAAALATLTFPAQRESMLVAGNGLGALLVLVPVVLASEGAPAASTAAALGLAATYDAPTALAAALGCGALVVASGRKPKWSVSTLAAFVLAAAAPVAWMAWRRVAASEASLEVGVFSGFLADGADRAARSAAFAVARAELGVLALAAAALGVVISLRSRGTRPLGASLVVIAGAALASSALGAPAGPVRFSSGLLAGLAATSVLAACGMGAVVSAVANAKVPFARASAAMIVLLEIAVPVRVADDASLAIGKTGGDIATTWNARVFGDLPQNAVVLVSSDRLFLRARAAAATGALRSDVIVLHAGGMSARATSRAIAREPLLAPIVRDFALYGAPEEFSLSQLAAARPLLVALDGSHDKRFARHLLPEGAFDRYFVEPRGSSERVKMLAADTIDERTMRALDGDPPLREATRDVLRARALTATATGEREYVAAATAELRRLAPGDPLARVHPPEQNN